ncbi:hypothetical protein Heshes_24240 [Alicyclobacillus hesperidum]|uniref:AlwI restriction endonuclease n=1 Tax=Alicyclobacillus hesperidum TaxID=89784 RepID=A0A1H2X5V2_9BACL|nr:AlwI family type II restriction endonuclease [Alicyclobacillus hesperidum]GLV14740.1 hypothetical protein Heshes_24240 [Alicyclobacillus hesperidum]SDW88175.1 AlwI restriction endonuclease [Alicyclobacillus hesperidum]
MADRKIWFITRPERDPKFHRDALLALAEATDGFQVKWSGNRAVHQKYEEALNARGIKREHISNDGSGGRTWAAMLKTFAYVYTDDDGYLRLTKVGQKVLDKEKVHDNVTKQILTLQIPNAYFLESGFRPPFESGFRIRPARFLIKLTNQACLDYFVTKEEITFFALTAKTDNELSVVTDKIRAFRNASPAERELMKQSIAEEYDHRERSDRAARDYEVAHGDVAHTFMLICEYTGLVEYIRGEALRINPSDSKQVSDLMEVFDQRYPFNTRYLISLQRMAENNGLDVDSYKASAYGNVKPATNRGKTENKVRAMLAEYPDIGALTRDEIKAILLNELPEKDAEKYTNEVTQDVSHALNQDFVETYLHEPDNRAFEDKTGEIFKAIGFDVEMRPKPNADVETEIEILLKYGDRECGIIDAKNYKNKFALSASLASHMASEYIPNYDGYDGRKVMFFGYVTAADWSGERNLTKISQLAARTIRGREIKGIMLSARVLLGFLDYCMDNNLSREQRISKFLRAVRNEAYSTLGEFLRN